jgi:hypothetical protein
MSVAGILASNLFSNVVSQLTNGAKASAGAPGSGSQQTFSQVQKGLSALSSNSTTGMAALPSSLTQLGQDLKSGNLPGAQADLTQLESCLPLGLASQLNLALHPATGASGSPSGISLPSSQSGAASDPMTVAMKLYGAFQQSLTSNSSRTSLMA